MAIHSEHHPEKEINIARLVRRRLDIRILPIICWLSLVTALDTTNVSFAKIMGLTEDLRLQDQDFSVAVIVFYIPCIFLDVPANLAIQKTQRPGWFLGGLALACGLIAIGEGFSKDYGAFVACRFLLGICQTGIQAGSIFLLAAFYPRHALHKRISALMTSRLVANAIGGLIAYGVAHLDGDAGLASWRWLFIIEGTITCLSALVVAFFLPGWPQTINFLNTDEKEALVLALEEDSKEDADTNIGWPLFREVLREPKIYFNIVLQFCCTAMSSSAVIFLPTILRAFHWSRMKSLSCTTPIFLTALIVMILNGVLSDYKNIRYPYFAGPTCFAIISYIIMLAADHISVTARYVTCFFLISGVFTAHATALVWLSNNFVGRKRRGIALGIIASVGNLGFILGSNVYLERESPWYPTGMGLCLGLAVLAFVTATLQLLYFVRDNKGRQRSSESTSLNKGSSDRHVY